MAACPKMNTSLSPLVIRKVQITCPEVTLEGILNIPVNAKGLVIFAHGSGSSRLSPRNQYVARVMHEHHLATLLFDLLTKEEDELDCVTAEHRFNIGFLSDRLIQATLWAQKEPSAQHLGIGYFGSSTGAAAALVAASENPKIEAVVSRGGRTDLADHVIENVSAPTLCIAGGDDLPIVKWNQETLHKMTVEKHLSIIPGATHLFPEPGALESMAHQAAEWFEHHFLKSAEL